MTTAVNVSGTAWCRQAIYWTSSVATVPLAQPRNIREVSCLWRIPATGKTPHGEAE